MLSSEWERRLIYPPSTTAVPLPGIPPTGKEATLTFTDIYRIVDGKIVEQWTEGNLLSLLQQLGVIPALGQQSQEQ